MEKTNCKEEKVRVWRKESLRVYDRDKEKWRDGKLIAKSNGSVECDGKSIEIGPFVTTTRPQYGNFEFVFVINTVKETRSETGPRFACKTRASCERWISLLNLVAEQKKLKLKHVHPLTEDPKSTAICRICKERADLKEDRSTLADLKCEFCDYNECRVCRHKLRNIEKFVTSIQHPHPLMILNSDDKIWLSSDYSYSHKQCGRCDAVLDEILCHCVECGDYDLCTKCAGDGQEGEALGLIKGSWVARTPDELRLNEYFLAPVLKTEGTKYSLVNTDKHMCPEKMSLITYKCFNLDKIDTEVHPSAYMEVTFDKFNKDSTVGVGINSESYGQNYFLGLQHTSFGVYNNGSICANKTHSQSFPSIAFSAGDTIGIGVMKDSFNQRTVFFTKNGKKIGVFEWRVHTGMDCFPGVSFSKNSGVAFSVNFSGPFKCDLSQVAEPRTDKDMLSTLPHEIIETICVLVIESATWTRPMHIRQINKLFANVMQSNTVWRALFLQKWPNQNAKLKVKSWQQFFRKRRMAILENQNNGGRTNPIENCDMEFDCPMLWEKLKFNPLDSLGRKNHDSQTLGISEAQVVVSPTKERYCDTCQKTVYEVNDEATMKEYIQMGRCATLILPRRFEDRRAFKDMRLRQSQAPFVNTNPFSKKKINK